MRKVYISGKITGLNIDCSFSKEDEEAVKNIYQMQDAILLKRLKEEDLLDEITKEEARRFKKFMIEQHQNIKTVYYDDGSIDGKVIVSFETTVSMDEELGLKIEVVEKEKLSRLVGKLSEKGAEEMIDQIKDLKNEWEVNIKEK